MRVVAAQGQKCPREENPRAYITDDVPADVPETSYYRRLVADGSLIEATKAPAAKGTGGNKPKGGK